MKEADLHAIGARIKSLRRKVHLWFLIDGLSRLFIILFLYLALTFWIDYTIRDLPVPLRLCLLAAAVIITILLLIKKTIIPVLRLNKIPNDALVLLIEKQFPSLKERLINLWQLPNNVLTQQLTGEITPLSQSFDFSEILFPHRSRKLLLGALALLFLSIISVTFYPSELGIWSKRLMGGNISWPKRTLLAVKVSPDYTIAKGQNLSVIAWPEKGPRLSAVYIKTASPQEAPGNWERMIMTQAKGQKTEFRYDFPKVRSSFRFMLKGGDDQTEWTEIKVLDAPSLEKISVSYAYPPYTGLENKAEPGGNIKAPAGTIATINASANSQLQSASIMLDSTPLPLTLANNVSISATLTVDKDAKYSLNLVSTNGLKNLEPFEYTVKSIPDSHPTIKVIDPTGEIQYVTADATVPLKAIASDDYGLTDARIVYVATLPESESIITTAYQTFYRYDGPLSNKIELAAALDLAPLNLKENSYLILNFTATDNCGVNQYPSSAAPSPLGVGIHSLQTTTSSDYSLVIISKPQMAKRVEESIMQLKDDLKKTAQIQEAAREAREIQPSLSNQRRVTQNLNNASSMLSSILKDIDINKLFSSDTGDKLSSVQDAINKLASDKSPAVQQSLEKTAATKDAKDDETARAEAQPKQKEIADDLKSALNTLEEWEDYQEVVNNVRDLLSETNNLSERIKKPLSDEPSSREMEKDRLNEQARNLKKESDNLTKKMARVADKLKDSHPYYSDKLKTGLEKLQAGDNLNNNLLSLLSNLSSSLSGQVLKDTENIQKTLAALLDFLEDRVSPEELQKKLAELKKMLEKVNELRNAEEKIKDATAGVLDPTGQISAAAQELDSLLLDQKALNEVTEKALAEVPAEKLSDIMMKLAEEQQALQDQAKELADRLAQANSQLKPSNPDVQETNKSLQSSADKMSQANRKMAQPQQGQKSDIQNQQSASLQDLRQARESLKKFLNRQLTEEEKRKLERLAQRQKELKEETEKAAKESDKDSQETLQSAAQKMSQAQNNLSNSKPQDAE
ncbi:MAG: DUF4175 family protein [Planctomycetota bacterium]